MKHLETERRNLKTMKLDSMEIADILKVMNEEDALIPLAIRDSLSEIEEVIKNCVESIKKGGRVVYAGAGTSGRMAVVDAVETIPTFNAPKGLFTFIMAGGNDAIYKAIEAVEDSDSQGELSLENISITSNDILIGIAASGRTPFVRGALRKAREIGCKTVLIANVSEPELSPDADYVIKAVTGPEVITGSTRLKAGSAQKMILNMISSITMIKLGKVYSNLMVDVLTMNEKLKIRAISIVCDATGSDENTARLALEKCEWHAKNAIIQILLSVSAEDATVLLNKNDGYIRRAVLKDD